MEPRVCWTRRGSRALPARQGCRRVTQPPRRLPHPELSVAVLVPSGCYSRAAPSFPTDLEAMESKIKVLVDSVSGGGLLPGSGTCGVLSGARGRGVSPGFLLQGHQSYSPGLALALVPNLPPKALLPNAIRWWGWGRMGARGFNPWNLQGRTSRFRNSHGCLSCLGSECILGTFALRS